MPIDDWTYADRDDQMPTKLDKFGHFIMFQRNPYAKYAAPKKDADLFTNPARIIDGTPTPAGSHWHFRAEHYPMRRTLLVPYYVLDSDGDEVQEQLLVGYRNGSDYADVVQSNTWGAVGVFDVEQLAELLLRGYNPDNVPGTTTIRALPKWRSQLNKCFRYHDWAFTPAGGGATKMYRVEKVMRIPYVVDDGNAATPNPVRELFVGYVGGAGY